MIDLNALAERSFEAIKKRKANGAQVSIDFVGSLKHAAGEIVEALEAWLADGDETGAALELADVIICCLVSSMSLEGCDMEGTLLNVIKRNEARARMQGDKI